MDGWCFFFIFQILNKDNFYFMKLVFIYLLTLDIIDNPPFFPKYKKNALKRVNIMCVSRIKLKKIIQQID